MRVNLITEPYGRPAITTSPAPLSLTIRPAGGLVAGDYRFEIGSAELMKILALKTNLPTKAIKRFEENLCQPFGAKLFDVELSERVLTDIGYFID